MWINEDQAAPDHRTCQHKFSSQTAIPPILSGNSAECDDRQLARDHVSGNLLLYSPQSKSAFRNCDKRSPTSRDASRGYVKSNAKHSVGAADQDRGLERLQEILDELRGSDRA
jgi:hypothetical protein